MDTITDLPNIQISDTASLDTPRSRKRAATSPLEEQSVGSARITRPNHNHNPKIGTLQASVTGSTPPNVEENLLSLRKKYHRAASALTQIEHHQSFMQECISYEIVPKGLQINVQPYAFLSEETEVKKRFNKIIIKAQEAFKEVLLDHYDQLQKQYREKIDQVTKEISQEESKLTTDNQTHSESLEKTKANIEKKKKLLIEKATKKLEILKDPTKQQKKQPQKTRPRNNTQQQLRRTQYAPSYAAAVRQNFQTGGPGQVNFQPQPTRPTRTSLLPNPNFRGPPPIIQPPPPPPLFPTQTNPHQIIQTITHLLYALIAKGN